MPTEKDGETEHEDDEEDDKCTKLKYDIISLFVHVLPPFCYVI